MESGWQGKAFKAVRCTPTSKMITRYALPLAVLTLLVAVFYNSIFSGISSIDIGSFQTESPATCQPSDINLDPARIENFFRRAAVVSSRAIHDEHDLAPCYVQGTLVQSLQQCRWTIRPGGIGTLTCGTDFKFLVCTQCDSDKQQE